MTSYKFFEGISLSLTIKSSVYIRMSGGDSCHTTKSKERYCTRFVPIWSTNLGTISPVTELYDVN